MNPLILLRVFLIPCEFYINFIIDFSIKFIYKIQHPAAGVGDESRYPILPEIDLFVQPRMTTAIVIYRLACLF